MNTLKNQITDLDHNKIGRTTLFKFVLPSLIIILFLPLFINSIFQLFNGGYSAINRTYLELYYGFIRLDKTLIIISTVQIIALILGIYKNGAKASKLILEKHKGLFIIGFKTVLILWAWIFISATLAACIFSIFVPHFGDLIRTLVYWLLLMSIPYLIFAIAHSLSIGYFIGRRIKTLGERRFV